MCYNIDIENEIDWCVMLDQLFCVCEYEKKLPDVFKRFRCWKFFVDMAQCEKTSIFGSYFCLGLWQCRVKGSLSLLVEC